MKKILVFLTSVSLCLFLIPFYSQADAINGVTDMKFDAMPGVNPKILPVDGKIPYTFSIDFDLIKLQTFCGANNTFSSFKLSVLENYDGKGVSGEAVVAPHVITFGRTSGAIHSEENGIITTHGQTLPTNPDYKGVNQKRYYFAIVDCPNGKRVTKSAGVPFVSPQQVATYACIVSDTNSTSGYTYACSSKGLTNCSDVQCGSSACTQISAGLCGSPAPNPSGNSAVCGNNKCESGETQEKCPADCKPGSNQNYFFEIINPLKGGASDFTSLVKIIAQWIFNLAIPIAVAMIVYAGILFLTAAGEPAKVTKAREVLMYAVIGLAIILIGSGFVTLIQSILELGGTGQPTQQGPGVPLGPNLCNNGVCANGTVGPCQSDSDCVQAPSVGAVGNKCSKNSDCFTGLACKNTICQRATGNFAGEACVGPTNCDVGLTCDKSDSGIQVIDGQNLGTCVDSGAPGGQIGEVCQKDSECISGLKCNQICQRKDGNLNDEACLSTSNPSNCKSTACSTLGTATEGVCVNKP